MRTTPTPYWLPRRRGVWAVFRATPLTLTLAVPPRQCPKPQKTTRGVLIGHRDNCSAIYPPSSNSSLDSGAYRRVRQMRGTPRDMYDGRVQFSLHFSLPTLAKAKTRGGMFQCCPPDDLRRNCVGGRVARARGELWTVRLELERQANRQEPC